MCRRARRFRSLKEIAAESGHPEFAQPWTLPSTAVQAYPHDAKQGTPAMAPANPADPKIKIPVTQTGPRGREVRTRRNGSRSTRTPRRFPPISARRPLSTAGRTRALMVGVVFSVIAGLALALRRTARSDHVLRAWVLGLMLTFGFAVGGLALLMVQYCSGGKWGLLLRRPLEAMSRTLPLVFVYWLVVALFDEEALPVGAVHHCERYGGGAEGGTASTRFRRTASTSSGPC